MKSECFPSARRHPRALAEVRRRVMVEAEIVPGQVGPVTISLSGEMADYVPQTNQTGSLRGICPVCERLMHRRVNYARLAVVARGLEVTFQEGEVSLRERTNPTVTCDFEMDGSIA